ncbi:MAG: N-acetyltransferase [Anaerolineae bacterium]|nr:MAG: N-acetyltransferase [Anaerolineae bacterium]WKZ43898.1 MAG: GNAT family protein [Anaerolineales bacterium]
MKKNKKTPEIVLGPLKNSDSNVLWSWINNRDQVLFNAPYKPVHESQHQAWFESILKRDDVVIFGIRLIKTNELIGACQLHHIDPLSRSAELQVRLGAVGERNKGYGTEAVRQLLRFGFNDLNLHRVYLHVFSANAPAIRVYEKLGLSREGLLRQAVHLDGRYEDVILMGILRDEFKDG